MVCHTVLKRRIFSIQGVQNFWVGWGGGSLTRLFYLITLFVIVKLGYPENFVVLCCLEVMGKFVVGGWWWVDHNQLCSYSNLVLVELNYVRLNCNNSFCV